MDQPNAVRAITPGATCAPAPAWADVSAYAIPETPNPHFVGAGLCALLDDSQIDLCGAERAWFYRRADLITAPSGAERAAQFSANFDPAYERLEVHAISVIRDGMRTEHAPTALFEVLRRERNMERLLFDGRLTVHVTLPDVRPGDVVEIAYTIYGGRKSLKGKFGAWIPQEWSLGIVDTRLRLRTPAHRTVYDYSINNPPQPTVTEADGVVDKRWRAFERPGIRFEPLTPAWITENAAIQFSEWRDWSEVGDTFAPLYEEEGPLPADIEAEIARIGAAYADEEERAGAILRFVQEAIRYLAIAIGEGGYTPRALADIAATRYGDCKDKAKLFVIMARRLGLNACPALVNTTNGRALDTWLPSAVVFDHCIVRAEANGKVYWLDGTRSLQASPLAEIAPNGYGFALPLRANTTLEPIAEHSFVHFLETHERIRLGASPQTPVRYEMRFTSRRGRAESIRDFFQREGEVGAFKAYTESVQRAWPEAVPLRQTIERDDLAKNEITVAEVYEIAKAWTPAGASAPLSYQFSTLDLTMKQTFATLDPGERKHPIYLGAIGRITRRVDIEADYPLGFGGWKREIDCSSISYRHELRQEGPMAMVLEQSIDIRALTLPPEEADKYRAIVADLDKSDITVTETVNKKGVFAVSREAAKDRGGWIGWAIWLGLLAIYWTWRFLSNQNASP